MADELTPRPLVTFTEPAPEGVEATKTFTVATRRFTLETLDAFSARDAERVTAVADLMTDLARADATTGPRPTDPDGRAAWEEERRRWIRATAETRARNAFEMVRFILDPVAVAKQPDQRRAWLDSEIPASEFWAAQDIGAMEAAVRSFRVVLGLAQ